jgi:hypothetical protein
MELVDIKQQLEELDTRVVALEEFSRRYDGVDRVLSQLVGEVGNVGRAVRLMVETMHDRFLSLDSRMDRMDAKMDRSDERWRQSEERWNRLDERLTRALALWTQAATTDVKTFAELDRRLSALEHEPSPSGGEEPGD